MQPKQMRPQMMVVGDISESFVPFPNHLLVNLVESKDLVRALLASLPSMFANTTIRGSCLGSALKAAKGLLAAQGGRITVFQATIPNIGDGAITRQEDAGLRLHSRVSTLSFRDCFVRAEVRRRSCLSLNKVQISTKNYRLIW
jgi:protein transport protein SEC24